MNTAHQYEVNLEWAHDRKGIMHSPVLTEQIEVATPPEFPKGMPNIWSPEHLFVSAINSCLMTTFLAIAENSKLEFQHFSCKANGKLEQVEGKYLMTEVVLEPVVTILYEGDRERAERILQKSEAACLISNSVKSTIHLKPTIQIA